MTTSSVSVTVNQTLTSIVVSPSAASLTSGQTQSFAATARDQFGNVLLTQPSFSWTLDAGSVGSVDVNSGLYTAPLSPVGSATVRATGGAISGTASINVAYLKGDVSIDGQRDIGDAMAMMSALTDLSSYQSTHSLSSTDLTAIFDTDGDMIATNADLQGLLVLLANGGGAGGGSTQASAASQISAIPMGLDVTDLAPAAVQESIRSPGEANNVPFVLVNTNGLTIPLTTRIPHSASQLPAAALRDDQVDAVRFKPVFVASAADEIVSVIGSLQAQSLQPIKPEPQLADARNQMFRVDLLAVDHFFQFHPALAHRGSSIKSQAADDLLEMDNVMAAADAEF